MDEVQIAVEDGVDAVLRLGAAIDERQAVAHQMAKLFCIRIRKPDLWEIINPEQLGQFASVDLVGLELGLGDDTGPDGVGENDTSGGGECGQWRKRW